MDQFLGTNLDTGEQYLLTIYRATDTEPERWEITVRDHDGATWQPPVELVGAP